MMGYFSVFNTPLLNATKSIPVSILSSMVATFTSVPGFAKQEIFWKQRTQLVRVHKFPYN
jgi:hypothetical protein